MSVNQKISVAIGRQVSCTGQINTRTSILFLEMIGVLPIAPDRDGACKIPSARSTRRAQSYRSILSSRVLVLLSIIPQTRGDYAARGFRSRRVRRSEGHLLRRLLFRSSHCTRARERKPCRLSRPRNSPMYIPGTCALCLGTTTIRQSGAPEAAGRRRRRRVIDHGR